VIKKVYQKHLVELSGYAARSLLFELLYNLYYIPTSCQLIRGALSAPDTNNSEREFNRKSPSSPFHEPIMVF
jgi:hypothetical protein